MERTLRRSNISRGPWGGRPEASPARDAADQLRIVMGVDPAAYSCINAKRVDLLLVDEDCMPRHAIEYQGSGHHQGAAAARDAVKKEALRRAGVGYHEVVAGQTTPADLRSLVERLVDKPKIGSPAS